MQRKGTSHKYSWNRAPRQVINSERIWVTTKQPGRTNTPQVFKQFSIIWRSIERVLCIQHLHKKAFNLHKGRAMSTPTILKKTIGNTRSATSVGIKNTLHHIAKPSWIETEKIRRRMTTLVRCPKKQAHILWLEIWINIFKRPMNNSQLWSAQSKILKKKRTTQTFQIQIANLGRHFFKSNATSSPPL